MVQGLNIILVHLVIHFQESTFPWPSIPDTMPQTYAPSHWSGSALQKLKPLVPKTSCTLVPQLYYHPDCIGGRKFWLSNHWRLSPVELASRECEEPQVPFERDPSSVGPFFCQPNIISHHQHLQFQIAEILPRHQLFRQPTRPAAFVTMQSVMKLIHSAVWIPMKILVVRLFVIPVHMHNTPPTISPHYSPQLQSNQVDLSTLPRSSVPKRPGPASILKGCAKGGPACTWFK